MSTPKTFTDAVNAWIRCGNREADPMQADAHRAWQAEQAALYAAQTDCAANILSAASAMGTDAARATLIVALERELERIGMDCPLAQF